VSFCRYKEQIPTFAGHNRVGTVGAISRKYHTCGAEMNATLSDHANVRLQQRGIPRVILDRLLCYGKTVHDHHGSEVVFCERRARNSLREVCGAVEFIRLESKLHTYAVVGGDGIVITVGQRTKRINRN
jgi:hypothetical protein